jgi:hypothetical protein
MALYFINIIIYEDKPRKKGEERSHSAFKFFFTCYLSIIFFGRPVGDKQVSKVLSFLARNLASSTTDIIPIPKPTGTLKI